MSSLPTGAPNSQVLGNLESQEESKDDGKIFLQSLTEIVDISNFRYKIDNSSIVARNLKSILFSEEFADVVIISGMSPSQERIHAHR